MFYVRDQQEKVHVLETPENYKEEREQRLEDFKALDSVRDYLLSLAFPPVSASSSSSPLLLEQQQQKKAQCGPRQNRPLV